jgi:hypothetical protein
MEISVGDYYKAKGRSDIVGVIASVDYTYVRFDFIAMPSYKIEERITYYRTDFEAMFDYCPEFMATKQFDEDLEKLLNE